MLHWLKQLDRLLRGDVTREDELREGKLHVDTLGMAVIIVVLGMLYGACMGSYSLLKDVSPSVQDPSPPYMQLIATTVKVPALFFLTLLVTFPSLYVFNALVGSRLTISSVLRLLVASLAVNLAVLASLGPIVLFFSVSTKSFAFVLLLNVVMFGVAGILGLIFLRQTLNRLTKWRPVGQALPDNSQAPSERQVQPDLPTDAAFDDVELSPLDMPPGHALGRHTRLVFGCWMVVFSLVGAQMGWVLRPFIGNPNLPFAWFRPRQSNFFEAVLNAIQLLLSGKDDAMQAWLSSADDILRRAPWVMHDANSRRALLRMVACLVLCGLFYGAVMGTFRALASQPQWALQIAYSAVKVPLLLTVTFVISLPSFFVVNTLVGLRKDFSQSVRALVAAQAGLAIVLAALTPLTFFWYTSSAVHREALVCNTVMFAIASFTAQWLLRGYYRPLTARNPRHRLLLWCWLAVYTVVAIQMAWLMRPFLGAPGQEVVFLRPEAWDNAYVIVIRLMWRTFFG